MRKIHLGFHSHVSDLEPSLCGRLVPSHDLDPFPYSEDSSVYCKSCLSLWHSRKMYSDESKGGAA